MGFIFGGNTGETQESIKRKREYAQALMAAKGAPRDVGEGLNSLGNAIAYRMALSQIGKGEAAMAEKNASLMAPIVESFGGGAQQFPAPPAPNAEQMKAAISAFSGDPSTVVSYANQGAIRNQPITENLQGNLADAITAVYAPGYKASVYSGGQTGERRTGSVRHNDGKAADVYVIGPDGKKVQGDALAPLGQYWAAKKYGGVGLEMHGGGIHLDEWATPPKGGGMHWNYAKQGGQYTPAMQQAMALGLKGQLPSQLAQAKQQQAPTQVASLDPSAGMSQQSAPSNVPVPADRPAANAIRKMLGGQEQPAQVAQAAPQGQVSEQQVVQELFGSPAPRPQLNPGMLMQALSDPNISEQNRATLQGLLQQEMQKQDPAYQLQQQQAQLGLQKDQLQLDQMRDPSKVPMTPLQQLQMQKSQLELQQMQNPGPNLKEIGGRLVQVNPDGTAKEIYAPPPEPIKEPAKPAEIQEYEYAKGQGFPGSFQDWKASQKGGMSIQTNPDGTMTFQQGGNIKPMTADQSKDAVYSTRAEGSLPLLDELASELTGVRGNTLGQLPLVGNALKPEKFQQAEQAAAEFLQAILRKDTGAAITEGEQALYGNTYIPRMGDGEKVIQQKKEARYRALQAMKAGMTPQAILAQEKALQNSGNAPMAPLGAPDAPAPPKRLKFNPATGELE